MTQTELRKTLEMHLYLEILRLQRQQLTLTEIAKLLKISRRTVVRLTQPKW